MKKSKLSLKFDDKDLLRRLKKVDAAVGRQAAAKALRAGSHHLMGVIKKNIAEKPLVDSGDLMSSVTEDELRTGSTSWTTFGPHKIYAAIHEFGGVIFPTNGPYLVFKGKDGNLVFTKSVTIPARPYIRPAIDTDGDKALEILGETLGREIDGAFK